MFQKSCLLAAFQALTTADIGVAIGSGSVSPSLGYMSVQLTLFAGDVAISSASFILLSSDLRSLLILSDLSRKVFNRVKFNLVSSNLFKTYRYA